MSEGVIEIQKSKIVPAMRKSVTRALVDATWKSILAEVPYASQAINMLEQKIIYDHDRCVVAEDDPVLKPDHTASRGFIDSENAGSVRRLVGFDPAKATYEEVRGTFTATEGAALQAVILQILGMELEASAYHFPEMHAQGRHLFFKETGDLTLDHTKHFISYQNIAKLDAPYRDTIRKAIAGAHCSITESDWYKLQQLYKGALLSEEECTTLVKGLSARIFSRMWELDSAVARLFKEGAEQSKKPLEYAYSTYLRGNGVNHGTWRVVDIIKGFGVLHMFGTHPVPVRGYGTVLEQTAGMAATTSYKTASGALWEGPGAFLELASRPYQLQCTDEAMLLHEVVIQLDERTWKSDKAFIDQAGNEVTLSEIQAGYYGEGSYLLDSHGHAVCYEGFKEENAKGIFFAAGGSVKGAV